MMDPQQELYTALRVQLEKLYPGRVYDGYLPPEGTPYPFVYLADSILTEDSGFKNAVIGRVSQTIHFYDKNPANRGSFSSEILRAKQIIHRLRETRTFSWDLTGTQQRILADNTGKQPLLHGVLDVDFRFTQK